MLVLSRKQTESICIDGDIVVTVLRIRGSHVKIGIEAPMGTRVHRRELYATIEGQAPAGHVEAQRKGKP